MFHISPCLFPCLLKQISINTMKERGSNNLVIVSVFLFCFKEYGCLCRTSTNLCPCSTPQQIVLWGSVQGEFVYNEPNKLPQHLAIQITPEELANQITAIWPVPVSLSLFLPYGHFSPWWSPSWKGSITLQVVSAAKSFSFCMPGNFFLCPSSITY